MMQQASLQGVGLDAGQEAVYRALLSSRRGSVSEVARALGSTRAAVARSLTTLQARGLVSRTPGQPVRFVAASPDSAIEVLVLQRQHEIAQAQAELQEARLAAAEMVDRYRRSAQHDSAGEVVELIQGPDAISLRYLQLLRTAEHEVLELDRPPYASSSEACAAYAGEMMRRGVRYRTVYDASAGFSGRDLERLRWHAQSGEHARTHVGVPAKLTIVDGRVALLGISVESPDTDLLVRRSALLDVLIALFEMVWDLATPVIPEGDPGDSGLSAPDRHLLALLAAGLTDAAIAGQLGVTTRTVERRLSRVMVLLRAKTRFQAAALAIRKGWLP